MKDLICIKVFPGVTKGQVFNYSNGTGYYYTDGTSMSYSPEAMTPEYFMEKENYSAIYDKTLSIADVKDILVETEFMGTSYYEKVLKRFTERSVEYLESKGD